MREKGKERRGISKEEIEIIDEEAEGDVTGKRRASHEAGGYGSTDERLQSAAREMGEALMMKANELKDTAVNITGPWVKKYLPGRQHLSTPTPTPTPKHTHTHTQRERERERESERKQRAESSVCVCVRWVIEYVFTDSFIVLCVIHRKDAED